MVWNSLEDLATPLSCSCCQHASLHAMAQKDRPHVKGHPFVIHHRIHLPPHHDLEPGKDVQNLYHVETHHAPAKPDLVQIQVHAYGRPDLVQDLHHASAKPDRDHGVLHANTQPEHRQEHLEWLMQPDLEEIHHDAAAKPDAEEQDHHAAMPDAEGQDHHFHQTRHHAKDPQQHSRHAEPDAEGQQLHFHHAQPDAEEHVDDSRKQQHKVQFQGSLCYQTQLSSIQTVEMPKELKHGPKLSSTTELPSPTKAA